jgi:amino acid adenylation domain-containing protein
VVKIVPSGSFIPFRREEIEQSISRRFEQQAIRHAGKLAVKTRHRQINFGELNCLANRVANAILSKRGDVSEPIATLLRPGTMGSAAVVGILKARKIWVPLDPSYPGARLIRILQDTNANLIVTDSKQIKHFAELQKRRDRLFLIDELPERLSGQNPNLNISPDTRAYIIYTSGSTGEPKGIVQNHRNVLHSIYLHTNTLAISSDDRLTAFSSYGHLAGVTALFRSLLNGAGHFPFDILEDGIPRIADWLIDNEITIYTSVPTVFRHFVDSLQEPCEFPFLRLIHLGGEPVLRRDTELYKQYFSSRTLFLNNLGSTEVGIYRQFLIDKETTIEASVVPVGYAIEDKEVLLVDDQGRESPPGHPGEIVIKSPYIALEYWNKPELTRRAFLQDTAQRNQRLFHTGDIGRMLSDGCLVLLGRGDEQIKIRGERIETGEIEAILLEHPQVKECAVIALESGTKEKQLIAYIVSNQKTNPPIGALDTYLKERLPPHMVPARFVFLDAMPLTPGGKVHRKALPNPDNIRPSLSVDFVSPRSAIEVKLAEFWGDILGVHPIGINDNFFLLGGHSLSAARLCSLIEKHFGKAINPSLLFQAPTIALLAGIIGENKEPLCVRSMVAFRTEGFFPPFFCIPGNLGNVFTDLNYIACHLGPDQPFYGFQDLAQNPSRIEHIAAHYLREIQTVQPVPPYFIGGLCSGAYIAFEISRQIRARGQNVALLALIEPPPPHSAGIGTYWGFVIAVLRRIFRRPGYHTRKVILSGPAHKTDYLKLKIKQIANTWAFRSYRPHAFDGGLDLFLSADSLQHQKNPQRKWLALSLREARLHEIPGTHNTITGYANTAIEETHIMVLAKKLKARIYEWHLQNSPNK